MKPRRPSRIPAIVAIAALVVALVGWKLSKVAEPDRAIRESVRVCLRENLGEPKWEEVRWWAPAQVRGETAIRLKYRSMGPFGVQMLSDEILLIEANGKARRLSSQEDVFYRGAFPD